MPADSEALLAASPAPSSTGAAHPASYYQRNLYMLSLAFFAAYTAFSGTQNLASSALGSVGNLSVAVLYLALMGACLGGPRLVKKLGVKTTLLGAFSVLVLYLGANAFVVATSDETLHYLLLLPASAAFGAAASALWTAQGTYLSVNATGFARARGLDDSAALGEFNGIFFSTFQLTQLSGNLGASALLNSIQNNGETVLFCVYVACAFVGTALLTLLRPVEDHASAGEAEAEGGGEEEEEEPSLGDSLRRTLLMARRSHTLQLLIPLICYSGLEQGWIWGDFTANYITPTLGLEDVGYVMAVFGCTDAAFSYLLGRLSDSVGRSPLLWLGAALHGGVAALLLVLSLDDYSHGTQWLVLCGCAFAWGIGDAVWNTQLNALMAELWPAEKSTAFANFKMWQALLTAVAFAYNTALGDNVKLVIVLATLGAGMAGWTALQAKQRVGSGMLNP